MVEIRIGAVAIMEYADSRLRVETDRRIQEIPPGDPRVEKIRLLSRIARGLDLHDDELRAKAFEATRTLRW